MKKLLCLTLLLASFNLLAEADVTLSFKSYIWSRPTAKGHELDITLHGTKVDVKLDLSAQLGFQKAEQIFKGDDYTAIIRAYRNNKENQTSYLILQTRVVDANHELIAECSSYGSVDKAAELGIGACTGRLHERQIGTSHSTL